MIIWNFNLVEILQWVTAFVILAGCGIYIGIIIIINKYKSYKKNKEKRDNKND